MSIAVDDKSRIIIPESFRKKLGLRKGSKVKLRLQENKVVIASTIDHKQFIGKNGRFHKRWFQS